MTTIPTKQLVDSRGGEFYPVTPLNVTDSNGGFNINVRHKLIIRNNNKPIYDGQELTYTTDQLNELIINNYPVIFKINTVSTTSLSSLYFIDAYKVTSRKTDDGDFISIHEKNVELGTDAALEFLINEDKKVIIYK